MTEFLRGKKTYIFMGVAILAILFLVWQGTMTVEQAVPGLVVALGFIGFRDAVAQGVAKLLAVWAEQAGRDVRGRKSAQGGPAPGGEARKPEEGDVRYH